MFRALGRSSRGERLEQHYVPPPPPPPSPPPPSPSPSPSPPPPPPSRMHGGGSPGRPATHATHASINMDQSTKPHQASRSQCVDIEFTAPRFISGDDQTPRRVARGAESIAFPALPPYLSHARTHSLTHTHTHMLPHPSPPHPSPSSQARSRGFCDIKRS